ncbi:ABC transporter ATP-binding protein [Bdellovibrio bacteriovorus]|uniref:ABC transporter ATP-binding protein n=1 Tax=Bdellovibrio bacteriovorus str. Tiberius TaxID=1069642 RepID=K7YSI2_BDEBC|nr:ABC transporter ATP-binding protein [Bdellovibrio bacteriovorus]AFY02846.1 ABC transporter ATP-binding protein [Bdellovibrio bacteriovorus str. Tiberius]
MSSIELKNTSYRYKVGGVTDVSFVVPEGKIACLLGPSGSGKTTLLKLIAGFLKPQAGSIVIGGEVIAGEAGRFVPPQERKIGLVFQQHALFPHLTVAKNILFGCTRDSKEERQDLLKKLLQDFRIEQHEHRYPHQISGGEQQRVAIARAIASDPKLLLMDEPFSSLDKVLRDQVQQQCLEVIRARGLTTVMVTHDEESAKAMGDLIIRLKAPQS